MTTHSVLPALPSRSILWKMIAGFFLLTFLVYGASLANRFVAWDDNYVIDFNPVVRGFTWDHLQKTFTTFVDPELYNPLTFISYQLDYTLGGLHPFIFHFTNLFLHTFNALFVAWLLFLLSKKKWIGLMGGILFAIHPLNTEAVAWASARKDTLSTFFFLLSLIAYLYHQEKDADRKWYGWSLVAFVCGLLSKVMVLTLPGVLLLIDYLQERKFTLRLVLEKIPYVVLSGIFGIIAIFGKKNIVSTTSPLDTLLMAAKSTFFYIEKLIWPTHLSVIYPYTKDIGIGSPDFLLPMLAVAIMGGIAVFFYTKKRTITFGILFYLLTLIPTFLNFAKGGEFYFASDRYAYIPQIGLIFLVLTLVDTFSSSHRKQHFFINGIAVIVVCIFSALTLLQSLRWHDSQTLFLQTLRYYPDAVVARINLGLVYRESGLLDKAMEQFIFAEKLRPKNGLIQTNIGATYQKEGRTDDAIAAFKKAIELEPQKPDGYLSLGMAYEAQGKVDEAFALYQKVLTINDGFVGIYNNLGSIYVQKNDLPSAEKMYLKAVDIDPYYPDAHFNLAVVYGKENRFDDAAREYETTLDLEGEKIDILQTLVGIYAEQNKTKETVRTLERMLAVDPANAFAKKFMDTLNAHGY